MSDDAKKKMGPMQAVLTLAVFGIGIWYYFGGRLEQQAATSMQQIENKVATDAVTQYNIAARNGTAMDRCVQAGMVSAAFLQAKDEGNWKQTEKRDCERAGISR